MCELVTIPISHYCEEARWALDRAGVRYRERAHLQGIHMLVARRAGAGSTVPVLICGDTVLADSAEIVAFADARGRPERPLYPDDPGLAAETRALERALLLLPLALGVVATAGTGVAAELAASLLTALGCLTVGAAVGDRSARTTPTSS
jgi:glutathione S-transferase